MNKVAALFHQNGEDVQEFYAGCRSYYNLCIQIDARLVPVSHPSCTERYSVARMLICDPIDSIVLLLLNADWLMLLKLLESLLLFHHVLAQ